MGLFSSKYVHHVGTTIQKLVDNDKIVNPYVLAIAEANMTGVDLVDNLLETSLNVPYLKARRFYKYVENLYPNKLPSGELLIDRRFTDAIQKEIQQLHIDDDVVFHYTKYGVYNACHEVWFTLLNDYGYDPSTGILRALETSNVQYVVESIGIELPIQSRGTTSIWEFDNWAESGAGDNLSLIEETGTIVQGFHALPVAFTSKTGNKARINYFKRTKNSYKNTVTKVTEPDDLGTGFLYIPLSKIGNGGDYFQVMYSIGEQYYCYEYRHGTGNKVLDSLVTQADKIEAIGEFYPNIYFRLDKKKTEEEAYIKMSKKLELDYAQLTDSIHSSQDIASVESALFTMGLSADSTDPLELMYCFDFFDQLWEATKGGVWTIDKNLSSWSPSYTSPDSKHKNAIHIVDDKFKYALTYEKLTRTTHFGKIGDIGFAVGGTSSEARKKAETVTHGDDGSTVTLGEFMVGYRYYRKQVATHLWVEIKVYDLTMVYTVFENYETTLGDGDAELCLIPLDKTLVSKYKPQQQNELHLRAYNFVFNSHIIEKLKWYQSGWFKALLVVVAVVIMIQTGIELYSSVIAAAEAGGAMAVMMLLANKLVVSVAITLGVKVFVKIAGPELAFFVAMAAAMLGFFKTNLAFITPDKLLMAASSVFNGISKYIKEAYADLKEEMDSFLSLKTQQEKELERAADLLEANVTPYAQILLGETPDQFLYRNTVFGCSGFTQLNAVDSYVDRSLQLPTTPYSMNF